MRDWAVRLGEASIVLGDLFDMDNPMVVLIEDTAWWSVAYGCYQPSWVVTGWPPFLGTVHSGWQPFCTLVVPR